MTRLIRGTLIAFGVGAVSFVAAALFANYAGSITTGWGSIEGMTPMWPLGIGLGAMSLMALSILLLIVCAGIGAIRDALATRRARTPVALPTQSSS